MKKFLSVSGMLLLFAACSNESVNEVINDALVPVKVHVSGFSVSQEELSPTRASEAIADYSGIKAVTLAFYNGSTEVLKTTQLRDDASTYTTFGEFDCSLPMGSYTMVVIARGYSEGDVFTLTSPTEAAYTGDRARETFSATQAVNISNTDAVDISTTLNRVIAKLQVISTDNKTANASSVRTTFAAGSKSFNPTTGLATTNTGFVNTVSISAAEGKTSSTTSYLFLSSDEQTMDVTIDVLDVDGAVLFSKTVKNVPFKRNRLTKLTGSMYTNNSVSTSFQVETAWLTDINVPF